MGGGGKKKDSYTSSHASSLLYNTIQYNETLLILKKEIQFAFDK